MISAADFPDVFPWMAERKPLSIIRVQIKGHSRDNIGEREELARPVEAALSASLAPCSDRVPQVEVYVSGVNGG